MANIPIIFGLTDRDDRKQVYILSARVKDSRLLLVPAPRNSRAVVFPAMLGPMLGDVRLFIRGGRLGYELVPPGHVVSTSPLRPYDRVTNRAFALKLPAGFVEGMALAYETEI